MLWTNHDNGWGMVEITEVVRIILKECMVEGLPLRGFITRGSVIFQRTSTAESQNFDVGRVTLAGKALVDAYQEEGRYSWSGCVISKECMDIWEQHPSNHYLETARRSKVIVDYCTPYKTAQDSHELKQVTALNWSRGRE